MSAPGRAWPAVALGMGSAIPAASASVGTGVDRSSVKIRLIADQAIGETDQRDVDGLGFDIYARMLASAAIDTRGPFTIGVFGEWGAGKTSLMRMVERH